MNDDLVLYRELIKARIMDYVTYRHPRREVDIMTSCNDFLSKSVDRDIIKVCLEELEKDFKISSMTYCIDNMGCYKLYFPLCSFQLSL